MLKSTGSQFQGFLEDEYTLVGVSDGDAQHLAAAFGIKTVRDLGSNKYFATAGVLVALSTKVG